VRVSLDRSRNLGSKAHVFPSAPRLASLVEERVCHGYLSVEAACSPGREEAPAEAAGITVEGDNKWVTIIQNAASSLKHERRKD